MLDQLRLARTAARNRSRSEVSKNLAGVDPEETSPETNRRGCATAHGLDALATCALFDQEPNSSDLVAQFLGSGSFTGRGNHAKAQGYPVPDLELRNRNDPSRLAGEGHRWQITSAKARKACRLLLILLTVKLEAQLWIQAHLL